jgi:methylmalonyl-CoA/ethylmalonyl-CoA epimerase
VFGRIDHIGVAVEDIDAAIALYRDSFEMELVHRETVEEQGVEAVLLDVGENHIELLAATGPDTPVGKFLAKKGPGMHHVAYQVEDIEAALGPSRPRACGSSTSRRAPASATPAWPSCIPPRRAAC